MHLMKLFLNFYHIYNYEILYEYYNILNTPFISGA